MVDLHAGRNRKCFSDHRGKLLRHATGGVCRLAGQLRAGCVQRRHQSRRESRVASELHSEPATTYFILVGVANPAAANSNPDFESGGKTVFSFNGPAPAGVSASPPAATIAAGASQTYSVTVLAAPFAGQVSLTMSGCPTNATCTFASSTVTAGSGTTLSIVTVAASAADAVDARDLFRGLPQIIWIWSCSVLRSHSLKFANCSGARESRPRIAIAATCIALAICCAGCGAFAASDPAPPPTTDTGTPTGVYTITITGTGNTITASTSVTLTVN